MAVETTAQPVSYRPGSPGERALTEMLAFIHGKSTAAYVRDVMSKFVDDMVQDMGGPDAVIEAYERRQREKDMRKREDILLQAGGRSRN